LVTLSWVVFDWHKRAKTAVQYEPIQRRIKALLAQARLSGCKRTARTAGNLLSQWDTLWLFTTRADVEPTNNAAERAIRTLVLKRKISGPARSRRGLEFVARGYSVVQSCVLQGRSALGLITDSVRYWMGQAVAPTCLRPAPATG
jgi:transposase